MGLIDFGQAQADQRVVEFSNMVLAIHPAEDQPGYNRRYLYLEAIFRIFSVLVKEFNEHSKSPYTHTEIIAAWEVLRLRIIEIMFFNRY